MRCSYTSSLALATVKTISGEDVNPGHRGLPIHRHLEQFEMPQDIQDTQGMGLTGKGDIQEIHSLLEQQLDTR